jgi:ketosteroid isomerase-like protein
MRLLTMQGTVLLMTIALAAAAQAQTTRAVVESDATKAIDVLRGELIDAFNKGDVDRLLLHLDDDVVVTWQNAEVCRGPKAVKAYYDRMMTGPNRIVAKLSSNPVVDDRKIFGDWAISTGNLHDQYTLNDGNSFRFDSHFTAVVARRAGEWKVMAFHASVNAFDNPILRIAEGKVGTWAAVIGAILGFIVGVVAARVISRKRRAPAVT